MRVTNKKFKKLRSTFVHTTPIPKGKPHTRRNEAKERKALKILLSEIDQRECLVFRT